MASLSLSCLGKTEDTAYNCFVLDLDIQSGWFSFLKRHSEVVRGTGMFRTTPNDILCTMISLNSISYRELYQMAQQVFDKFTALWIPYELEGVTLMGATDIVDLSNRFPYHIYCET